MRTSRLTSTIQGALRQELCCPRSIRFVALAASLLLGGCAAIGPNQLPADRFDYGGAIALSTNEQMLLNLVRLRYNETPVFLDVNTVIAQYQFDARARVGGEIGFSGWAGPPGDSLVIPELGAGWSEKPTITYAPRSGPKFIRSLLTPLPPLAVVGLMQGNWPVEDVVWGVVRSVNGVAPQSAVTDQWNPDYGRMLDALAQVQRARALGIVSDGDARTASALKFRAAGGDDRTAKAIATLREIWGLNPRTDEYKLVLGALPRSPDEIAMLTSSMLDLMRDIAALIEVPAEHVAREESEPTVRLPVEAPYGGRAPIRIQLHRDRPTDAFVAVRKDDWWYSIARNDLRSKRVLLLLNILFQLAESGELPAGPVITVPAGG